MLLLLQKSSDIVKFMSNAICNHSSCIHANVRKFIWNDQLMLSVNSYTAENKMMQWNYQYSHFHFFLSLCPLFLPADFLFPFPTPERQSDSFFGELHTTAALGWPGTEGAWQQAATTSTPSWPHSCLAEGARSGCGMGKSLAGQILLCKMMTSLQSSVFPSVLLRWSLGLYSFKEHSLLRQQNLSVQRNG